MASGVLESDVTMSPMPNPRFPVPVPPSPFPQVEANQEMKGLVCHGANVLPTRIVQDAFRDEYGGSRHALHLNVDI